MKQLGKFFLLIIIFLSPIAYVDFFLEPGVFNISYAALDKGVAVAGQSNSPAPSPVIEIEGHCSWKSPGSWMAGCLTDKIIYFSGILFVLGATVFDFFLQLTLSNGILDQTYISTAWVTMRDLANITFIFGIIAVAFMMITGMMGDWRKFAWKLIIVALLLNFSLFFTRVVIDAGNILGGFFYNQITAGAPAAYVKGVNGEEVKSPGAKLISSISVDKIMGGAAIDEMTKGGLKNPNTFWFTFNIAVLVMSVLMAKSMFKVGFFMLSRTVWLVIYSIISPLAFVAYFIPSAGGYAKDWFKGLVDKSFCVCAYLFILYITFVLVDGITLGSSAYVGDGNATWINLLIQMAITVGLVSTLMDKGTSIAQNMCEGGSGGIGSMAMKTTVGAAALVGGGAARAGLGQAGYAMSKGKWGIGALATSDNAVARSVGQLGLYAGDRFQSAKINGKSFEELQKAGSKRIEAQGNRLANLKEEELKEKYKDKEIEKAKAAYIKSGMSAEDAAKRAQTTGKINAGKRAKEEARKFGEKSIERTNSVLNFMAAGAVGGTKSEALATYKAVDEKEAKKQENKLAKLEEQRTFQMAAQNRREAIEGEVDNSLEIAIQGGDIAGAIEKLTEAIEPLYQSRRIENGTEVRELVPGTANHTAFTKMIENAQNNISSIQNINQNIAQDKSDLQLIKTVSGRVSENAQQGWARDEQVTPEEVKRLEALGVKTSAAGGITYDDSMASLAAAEKVLQRNSADNAKELAQLTKDVKQSIIKPVEQQLRAETQARANIATAEVEGIIEEARIGQDQVKDGRVEDQSREEKDVGNGSSISTNV